MVDGLVPQWQQRDLGLLLMAQRYARDSPCSVQVGAVLVALSDKTFAGCNRPPAPHPQGKLGPTENGCKDWCSRISLPPEKKCSGYSDCETVHAEAYVLNLAGKEAAYGTLYVTGAPCALCVRLIAASLVRRVVCVTDPVKALERGWQGSMDYLKKCQVEVRVIGE